MNDVCVVGYGMVGRALADVFGIKKIYTRDPKETTMTLSDIGRCKLIFICLPTPVEKNGEYFTKDIEKFIKSIEALPDHRHPIYVIRSTVYPGFALYLQKKLGITRIISNPEFLSEATAIEDTINPPFILIGGTHSAYRNEVAAFYASRIKGTEPILTDNTSAEMAKLTMNAYFATKVIFANQTYDACQNLGANYGVIKKVLQAHPYGPTNHFDVFFKGKRGVRGNCLPKDTKAFVYYTRSTLVSIVDQLNEGILDHDKV